MSGNTQIGLTPTQLALAWVYSREFVTSTVIGATTTLQLRDNLRSLNCPVTEKADEQIRVLYDKCVFVLYIYTFVLYICTLLMLCWLICPVYWIFLSHVVRV